MVSGSCLSHERPTVVFNPVLALEPCPLKHGAGRSRWSPKQALTWKAVPIPICKFTILPPASWDCWICLQASGFPEQQLCALNMASDLSRFSQDLCPGEDKSEHLAALEQIFRTGFCMWLLKSRLLGGLQVICRKLLSNSGPWEWCISAWVGSGSHGWVGRRMNAVQEPQSVSGATCGKQLCGRLCCYPKVPLLGDCKGLGSSVFYMGNLCKPFSFIY